MYHNDKPQKINKTHEERIYNEERRTDDELENADITGKEAFILVLAAFRAYLPQLLIFLLPLIIICVLIYIFVGPAPMDDPYSEVLLMLNSLT
ncbi:hypothetical protein PRVXH_002029 [Proteinivorax hydrogeniformans]|uniref:Uncharacterized protein n=1 Tax=Proteinivorax hydrogeniformans TaxID=1826727 RepID=A0AAU8HRA0_9FIRM